MISAYSLIREKSFIRGGEKLNIIQWFRDLFGDKETVYLKQRLESEKYKLALEDFAIQMGINLIAGALQNVNFAPT